MNDFLWPLVLALLLGYLVFQILRKRRERRDESKVDIPDFLSHGPEAPNSLGGVSKGEWLEIHPFPKRKQ